MDPVSDYTSLCFNLQQRFKYNYSHSNVTSRMFGLVFASPNSSFAQSEIIPQIADWHFRTGKHIDFFFAGFTDDENIENLKQVDIPEMKKWFYSSKLFDSFRREIESHTSWRSSGGCDLILTTVRYDKSSDSTAIDFTQAISCQLDTMKEKKVIESVPMFFEKIFRFAEENLLDNPIDAFSDSNIKPVVVSSVKQFLLSLIPSSVSTAYSKLEDFAVKDIGIHRAKNW